eukprot:3670077-Amphidinium_carterae.1
MPTRTFAHRNSFQGKTVHDVSDCLRAGKGVTLKCGSRSFVDLHTSAFWQQQMHARVEAQNKQSYSRNLIPQSQSHSLLFLPPAKQ